MKNPLHYQLTEYDCGPTSMLNAVSYLFPREEIPPEIVRNIMLYCLDCYGADGVSGKNGTSCAAMMFLSNWLDGFRQTGRLPISSRYLCGQSVDFGQNSKLRDALCRGGAAVVRVEFDGWHYVLLTGLDGDRVRMFDPYYRAEPFAGEEIELVDGQPDRCNRLVPIRYLERETRTVYALGPAETREAVLLFNRQTELTEDKTIEYII